MTKKKMDEMTLMRQKALESGKVVVTETKIGSKLRAQILRNYGLVIKGS